jgi:hypothetical protein
MRGAITSLLAVSTLLTLAPCGAKNPFWPGMPQRCSARKPCCRSGPRAAGVWDNGKSYAAHLPKCDFKQYAISSEVRPLLPAHTNGVAAQVQLYRGLPGLPVAAVRARSKRRSEPGAFAPVTLLAASCGCIAARMGKLTSISFRRRAPDASTTIPRAVTRTASAYTRTSFQ